MLCQQVQPGLPAGPGADARAAQGVLEPDIALDLTARQHESLRDVDEVPEAFGIPVPAAQCLDPGDRPGQLAAIGIRLLKQRVEIHQVGGCGEPIAGQLQVALRVGVADLHDAQTVSPDPLARLLEISCREPVAGLLAHEAEQALQIDAISAVPEAGRCPAAEAGECLLWIASFGCRGQQQHHHLGDLPVGDGAGCAQKVHGAAQQKRVEAVVGSPCGEHKAAVAVLHKCQEA